MTTSIIWLIYFADVLGNLQAALGILLTVGAMGAFAVCMHLFVNEAWSAAWASRFKWGVSLAGVAVLVLALLPSKQALYASAAVYAGGQMADTEEFRLVRQMVTQELRKMVEPKVAK